MGFIDSFALFGLFLVGLPVAWLLGWLLAKIFRAPGLARLTPALLLAVVVAAYPLALRFFGEPGRGRVVDRHETVRVSSRGGSVTHRYRFDVRYLPRRPERADVTARDPGSDSVTISMAASRAMFDGTPVGAILPVRYVSFRPSLAKLDQHTLGDIAREVMQDELTRIAAIVVACILVAAMLSGWRPTSPPLRAARGIALAACVLGLAAGAALTAFHPVVPPDAPPATESAVARVAAISHIVRGPFGRSRRHGSHLTAPFDVVQLELTPRSRAGSVIATDAIDTASARGLAVGRTVPVHYAPSDPRIARIDGATRTFDAVNLRDRREVLLILIAIVAALALFGFFRRGRGGRRARPSRLATR
jgi:hypothetical protein